MYNIDEILNQVDSDLKHRKVIDIRKRYTTKDDVKRVLVLMKALDINEGTKLIDFLLKEKYQQVMMSGGN